MEGFVLKGNLKTKPSHLTDHLFSTLMKSSQSKQTNNIEVYLAPVLVQTLQCLLESLNLENSSRSTVIPCVVKSIVGHSNYT